MRLKSIDVEDFKVAWKFTLNGVEQIIWFEYPTKVGRLEHSNFADSFLAFVLMPAMKIGVKIDLGGYSISKRLLEGISKVQNLYLDWFPELQLSKVKIDNYEVVDEARKIIDKRGLLFSGGVDSFDTLLDNANKIDSLIYVLGYDIRVSDISLHNKVSQYLKNVAKEFNKELLVIKTNVREFTEKYLRWDYVLAPIFAATVFPLKYKISQLYISSSTDQNHLFPYGSHPHLDFLYSTNYIDIIHYGEHKTRQEKIIDNISNSSIALNNLRVCWKNSGNSLNCGKCEKCKRTMLSLYASNVIDKASTFKINSLEELQYSIHISKSTISQYYKEILEELDDSPLSQKIKKSIEIALINYNDLSNEINMTNDPFYVGKKKNILFVDFNGVISYKNFWYSLTDKEHELHSYLSRIEQYLFKDNIEIILDWMLGKYTSEEIHKILEKEIGVPYAKLYPLFEKECGEIDISQVILDKLQELREFYTLILITDNMDSFDRFTLPNNQHLVAAFDRIDNSASIQKFKKTNDGEYFKDTITEYGAVLENCILMDDSSNNCKLFEDIGGKALKTTNEEEAIDALNELLELVKNKWEWQY